MGYDKSWICFEFDEFELYASLAWGWACAGRGAQFENIWKGNFWKRRDGSCYEYGVTGYIPPHMLLRWIFFLYGQSNIPFEFINWSLWKLSMLLFLTSLEMFLNQSTQTCQGSIFMHFIYASEFGFYANAELVNFIYCAGRPRFLQVVSLKVAALWRRRKTNN